LFVARRLRQLLVEAGETTRLLVVLERLAALEPNQRGRRHVLGEAAALADRLGDVDRALDLWQRCLDASEGDLAPLDARIALLERVERWAALIEDLRRRAQASKKPASRRADLVRIARTYETRLFRLEQAIDVWQEIEREFGESAESVDALVDLCAAAGRYADVVARLTAAVATETEPLRRTDQLARLGDVYREQEKAPGKAIEFYRQALELNVLHEAARSGLRALLGSESHGREAVETLAAALNGADEWPGVLELVELRVRSSQELDTARTILLEAANILEQRAQDPSGALAYMCRAFELTPSEEIEAELKRLARMSGEWGILVSGYQRAIERSDSPVRARQLRFQRGHILEDRMDDREDALSSYRQILDSDPTHRDAACAVARVATKLRAWNELAWVFITNSVALGHVDRKVADAIEHSVDAGNAWEHATQAIFERIDSARNLDAKVLHDLRRTLGIWYRDQRSDPKTAETLLSLAVQSQPDADTLRMLAELRRREPGRPLVETLLLLSEQSPEDLGVLYEAANVALESVRDTRLAEPILERARQQAGNELARLDQAPEGRAAIAGSSAERVAWWSIEALVKLEKSRSGHSQALRLLVDGAALPFDAARSIALSFEAAQLSVEALGNAELAQEICRGILEKAPSHAQTLELLAGLYEKSGQLSELLELRRRELSLAPPLERRLFLRLDEARILQVLGEAPARQIEALQKNVDESPGHAPSIERLEQILSAGGDQKALVELLSSQAEAVSRLNQPALGATLWAKAGRCAEEALGDVDRAVLAYEKSVQLEPRVDVLDALGRACAARSKHEAAISWFEQRLSLTPESQKTERQATLVQLASAARAAGREEQSRKYLSDGLSKDPFASELRGLLAESYRHSGDWEALASLLSTGVQFAPNPTQRAEYLRGAAKVRRDQLGQVELAIPLLEQAVQLEPGDRALRLSLADAFRETRRYEEARRLLTVVLEEFGRRRTPERARVHYQLAQIARATGDLDVALKELDLASKVDRDNIPMLQLLGEVAREKGQLEDAERAYRTLLLLLGRARPADAEHSSVIGESAILFELYRIANELGQHERAKDLLDSALEAGAHDLEEAKRLEQALRDAGHPDLLLRALEQRMARTSEGPDLGALLRSRAEVLSALGQREAALDCCIDALRQDPSAKDLVQSSWALAQAIGKTELVCAEVSRQAERVVEQNPDLACELWFSLGGLCESAGDNAGAAKFYTSAQGTGRKPLECLDAIERVGGGSDSEAQTRALETFVDNADPDAAPERYTDALFRLGKLELYQGKPSEAVQHIDVALTRSGDVRRVLDLLSSALSATTPTPPVIELLERVARDADDHPALLLALNHSARLGLANLEALHEAVDLARAANDPAAVRSLLEATVNLARDKGRLNDATWAVAALCDELEAAGQAQSAVDLLQETIAHSGLQESFELRLRLGALAAHPLGDLELAASVYERLLEEEPQSPRVFKPLFDIYRKMGDRAKLESRISSIEKAVEDPALRQALRLERMRILIDSDRKADAEAALKSVLDDDPGNDEASELLEGLLEKQGRLSELHSLIERRLNAARSRGDVPVIVSSTLRLAKILAETDPELAIDVFRDSMAQAGDNRQLLDAFLGLLHSERHASDRADVLYRLIGIEAGPAAVARTLELVATYKAQDDFAGVERALERGLSRVPSSEALHAERVQWYRQHDAWEKLAQSLCDHAVHLEHPAHRRDQIEQAALIYEVQLGDPRRAAETLELTADPAAPDPALLAKIAQHWLSAAEPGRALGHLTQAIELRGGGQHGDQSELGPLFQLRGNLRHQLGELTLASLDAAIVDLTRATELLPERARPDLAEALRRKLEWLGERRALDSGSETLAERGKTTMELARVLSALQDLDGASRLIEGWIAEHPGDKWGQLELGRLALERHDFRSAREAFLGLFPLAVGEERVAVALKLAEACEQLGDPLAAKEALEQAHAEFPGEDAIRRRLRKMYQAAKAYKGWAGLLMVEAASATDKTQKFELLCNAGDLYRQAEGGALAEARDAYAQAVAVEDDAKTLVKLVDVEVQLGQIEDAASRLDEAIRSHGKRRSPDLSLLQHAMARVASAAGDEEAIFAWLEAALYSDRQNGTVASELAALAMARGDYDVAIKALQLVTLLKNPGPMSRAEAYLRQAAIAKHRGDIKKSALLAKRAITTDPDYEEAKVFLGELQVSGEATDSLLPEA
jgi:lipopolysaccharide biosynthesis regulator YciM